MKRKILFRILIILILVGGAIAFLKNIYEPPTAVKKAVTELSLSENNYILCETVRVTGSDWMLLKDEDGKKTNEYCNITGADPFQELGLTYEFFLGDNIFVFYVTERTMVYSEATGQDEPVFVVSGWDILYPVKHSDFFVFDLFKSRRFILESDLY